jgi:hypothetical protein
MCAFVVIQETEVFFCELGNKRYYRGILDLPKYDDYLLGITIVVRAQNTLNDKLSCSWPQRIRLHM